MKKLLFLIFATIFVSPAIAQKADNRLKGLDSELNKVLETWHTPGFAVAIVEKDKIIYARGFGYSDYEKRVPVTPNTLFAIGSCTKAFTSSLLGILNSESKLSFDDSPAKYIPYLEFYNDEMNNSITIKDMMCHRTGLPRHDYSWYLFPTDSKDSLLQRIKFQEPFAGVRERWYYNNFMYLAQGVIAEKITGKSWEDNVREKIFDPLGMTRSNLSIDELLNSKDIATGYELEDDSIIKKMDYYHIAGMSPAGSINSSVNEMSNWLVTWINNGKFKGNEILPASYISQAISSQMVVTGALPDKENPDIYLSNYGFAWLVTSYKGHYRVEHGGNIDGFSANASFFPADSIGIVVLVNQNASLVPSIVRNIISDKVLKLEATDWNKKLKEQQQKALKDQEEAMKTKQSNRKSGTKPSHILQEYTGTFSNPGYGDFKISVERDSLFASFKLTKMWLRHFHYDIFEPFEVEETGIDTTASLQLKFNFRSDDAGEISGVEMKVEAMLDPINFKRTPDKVDIDKETLEKFAGEYEIAGTIARIYMKGDETLYLFITGQPEYELLATGSNRFSIKILEGFKIEFIEDSEGTVTELMFIQPNGTFTAKRK